MSALSQIEDTREPKYMSVPVAGYCTECLEDIYVDEDYTEFQEDCLCKKCEDKMGKPELKAWFLGRGE